MKFSEAQQALSQGRDVRRGGWAKGWWYRSTPGGLVSLTVDDYGTEVVQHVGVGFSWQDVQAEDWVWADAMQRVVSVLEHPVWETVKPYFGERPNELRGLEVRGLPRDLSMRLQSLELACCTCGRMIRTFRQRKGSTWDHLYFSPACPSALSPGCSRGAECRDEVDRIRSHLAGNPVQRSQLGLFERTPL